jgi:RNA polymerase sigma-70 factor, ECF subfamily
VYRSHKPAKKHPLTFPPQPESVLVKESTDRTDRVLEPEALADLQPKPQAQASQKIMLLTKIKRPETVGQLVQSSRFAKSWFVRFPSRCRGDELKTQQDDVTASTFQDDIRLAKRGDQLAIDRIVTNLHAKVLATCRFHCRGHQEFVDVAQATWIKVLKHLPRFDGDSPGKFSAYVFRIAMTTAIDAHRHRTQSPVQLPIDSDGKTLEPVEELSSDEGDELVEKLRKCFCQHDGEVDVVAFKLHHLDGLKYKEVAARLNISVGAATSRICRGKETIVDCMARCP